MTTTAELEKRLIRLEATRAGPTLRPRSILTMTADLAFDLDPWQRDVLTTNKREILMLAARQSGKSTVAALMAVHQSVYAPESLILILSPGERQSKLLLKTVKKFYRRLEDAPATFVENQLSIELVNGSEIHALPGTEHKIRGFSSVDLLIADEDAVVPDELYFAVRPMVAVSGGRIVLLSTPRGKRGHFYHEYVEGGDSWHRAVATAHDCPRIDPAWLEQEHAKIGDYWFRQEFLCEFVDTDDQLYPSDLVTAALSEDVEPLMLPSAWVAA